MAETKYGKYIVTRPKSFEAPTDFNPKPGPTEQRTRLFNLDDEVVKGASYVGCSWFWKGSEQLGVKSHTHDVDEVLAFIGTNPEDIYDLGGEIDLWLGDEKHTLKESCLVFIPKGLAHCPLIFREVKRPIFHFSILPESMYGGKKK